MKTKLPSYQNTSINPVSPFNYLRFLKKCGLSKQICFLLSFSMISLVNFAQTQQKKWYMNGRTIDFQTVPPTITNMPSGPNYQDGSNSATNGYYGPGGNLLLFVSGNGVYNKFGNLITTIGNPLINLNPIYGFTLQNFTMGKSVSIIPNPDFCERYFIIYDIGFAAFIPSSLLYGKQKILYTEIDLSANNQQGGVYSLAGVPQKDIVLNVYEGLINPVGFSDTYASFVVSKLINGKRLLYIANQVHDNSLFPQKTSSHLYKFEITGQGIGNSIELFQTNQFGFSSLDMEISHNNQYLAIGCLKYWSFDFINKNVDVALFHLNTNGDLNPSMGNFSVGLSTIDLPSQNINQGVGGIEFTPDNQRLFAAIQSGDIYYINLSNLSNQSIANSQNYTGSQIELAYNGYIYLAKSNSELIYIDWNLPTPVLITNSSPYLLNLNSNAIPLHTFQGNFQGQHYLLPKQIDGQNYDEFYNNYTPLCCAIAGTYDLYNFSAVSSATWNPQNNPLNNGSSNTAYIQNKLIIPSNTTITLQNMNLYFAPGASIEIHNGSGATNKGGKLILDNSVLTIDPRCSSLDLWKGIQVWGTSNQNQFPTLWSNFQATLEIKNNSIIEYAENAVTLWKPGDYNRIGGIVKCDNSFFKNNRRSVEFIAYQNFSPGGNPIKNLSYFTNTEFLVDNQYLNNPLNPNPFSAHVTIWKCDGIEFKGCKFLNLQTNKVYSQVSNIGIESLDAGYNVYGICSFPVSTGQTCPENQLQRSLFNGLDIGILARGSGIINTVNVQQSEFSDNVYGMMVKQVDHFVLQNSVFNVGCANIQTSPFFHEGLIASNSTGFKIESNIFNKSLTCSNPSTNFGLRIVNSGTNANRTFKNQFNNLNKAQIADGQNKSYSKLKYIGLRFICNENNKIVDNDIYIKRISTQPDVNEHGVSVFQGGMNAGESAGNKFTNGGGIESDIYNLTNFPINYYYSNGILNHQPLFNSSNVSAFPSSIQNSCIERPINLRMNNEDYTLLNLEIDSISNEFFNQNYLYSQMIDAGNTQALIDQVNYNWSNDEWELRTQLLLKSPFLSQDVLKEITSNGLLPNVLLMEVLLANPDATKDENFINFLLDYTTLSSTYIDLIRLSWDSNTTRTMLESLLSYTKEQLAERSNYLYNRLQTDSLKRTDDLRYKLNESAEIEDQIKLSLTYLDRGQYSLGKEVLDSINEQDIQSEYDLLKLTELRIIANYFQELFINDVFESNLSNEQIDGLVNLRNSFQHYYTKEILNNILCFHYRICDEIIEFIPEAEIQAKKGNSDIRYENLKDGIVKVYPNPASSYCIFEFTNKVVVGKEIKVYSLAGVEILLSPIYNNNAIVLNTEEIKNGIYFYEIKTTDNKIVKGKFTINRE